MAHKPKQKMSMEDRAKQFLPFAALKGLPEALAAREEQALRACCTSGGVSETSDAGDGAGEPPL